MHKEVSAGFAGGFRGFSPLVTIAI